MVEVRGIITEMGLDSWMGLDRSGHTRSGNSLSGTWRKGPGLLYVWAGEHAAQVEEWTGRDQVRP